MDTLALCRSSSLGISRLDHAPGAEGRTRQILHACLLDTDSHPPVRIFGGTEQQVDLRACIRDGW